MKSRHRAVILFKRLRFRLPESVRDTERATSIPKSSVHRQTKNQKLRIANLGGMVQKVRFLVNTGREKSCQAVL